MVIARRPHSSGRRDDRESGHRPGAEHGQAPSDAEPPSLQENIREDRLLVAAVAGRDQLALKRLYERHGGLLLHIAFDMVQSWESAEEVVQDVFVQCWNQASRYEPSRGTPVAWLISMTRSRAIDHLRRAGAARRGGGRTVPLDGLPDHFRDGDAPPGARLEIGDVGKALLELPREMRTAILLSAFGGLTHTEISRMLETPDGTVKSWIRRGLQRMRTRLQSQGVRT